MEYVRICGIMRRLIQVYAISGTVDDLNIAERGLQPLGEPKRELRWSLLDSAARDWLRAFEMGMCGHRTCTGNQQSERKKNARRENARKMLHRSTPEPSAIRPP